MSSVPYPFGGGERLRTRTPAAVLLLVGALAVVVLSRGGEPATGRTLPAFLLHGLGTPNAAAPLTRAPSEGVTSRITNGGYRVTLAGVGSVAIGFDGATGAWSRFADGASRPMPLGHETIQVGAERTEQFLTVETRQGQRAWRWHLVTGALRPSVAKSGAVVFRRGSNITSMRIAPARVLSAAGRDVTPAGVRWAVRPDGSGAWWLVLHLNDSGLELPYVVDPATDYPSPLYLSSTASTESGSWRIAGTAPNAANTATSTTPGRNATGYFLFRPGASVTGASNPSATPTGTGWVQDLAGGASFPAGSWSFSFKTQVPGTTLTAGTAVLAVGVWKGTISAKTFHATQTILAPTPDPASQNIRSAVGTRTTTVTYSLPAFSLGASERLYIDVWRRQLTGIGSTTASARQVILVVNDGTSRIVHPPAADADVTPPAHAFGLATSTGGVYLTSPGGATGTVYYRGSAAGSFSLTDTATDAGSGVSSVTYPRVATSRWTHAAETVTTAPAYTSSTYSWTAGATTSPGAQAIVAKDVAGNATTGSPLTITNDTTAPTKPSLALTSPPAFYTALSVALTPTDGTDAGSGVDTTTRLYQRDETTATNGVCGTFPNTWAATVPNPDTTVQNAKCYRYRLLESDHVGNQSAASAATATARIDLSGGAPDTTITSQPPNPSTTTDASFSFTSTNPASTFQCTLDGAPAVACTSPKTYSGLSNAAHTFTVQATAGGLTDATPASVTWTVDTTNNPLAVDEVHYTYLSGTSVSFDWRGNPSDMRYGTTTSYGSTVTAHTPTPVPYSSPGPFWQAELTGLSPGTTYHYSIGDGGDRTFSTPPTGNFRFDAIADLGSSLSSTQNVTTMNQIAADAPSFVLFPGDLTYGNTDSQAAVDQHFNDVMAWSQSAAYMPVWGNHEWDETTDDLRNYKGRFELPNAQAAVGAPSLGCCGDDWGWFDAGGIRFISYPEPYAGTTWSAWQQAVDPIFAAAQSDPSIHFIVTFGHRPPYSDGGHPGEAIAGVLASFGDRYNKYVLNLNGHSHVYERFLPIHGVTNITVGNSGSLDAAWLTTDSRTAYRARHRGHLVVDVDAGGLHISEVCGPPTGADDITCAMGDVIDSLTIPVPDPQQPPPPAPTLYVDNGNPLCSDSGSGTQAIPFCTISAASSQVQAGETVQVASGTYTESVISSATGTAQSPIIFTSAPGANVVVAGGTNGFLLSAASWVTINGFTVTGTTGIGVLVQSSSNITISNNHVSYSGQPVSGFNKAGINVTSTIDSIVSGNTVDHNTSYGIYLAFSTNVLVKGNTSAYNAFGWQRAASGIRLYGSVSNTITLNYTHDNEDSGIEFDGAANDNLTLENVSWNNGDHGIDDLSSPGQRIIGNSVYNNVAAGINVEGNSTGATIENNISVDNGIGSPRTHSDIRVENGSTAGTTMDYDLAYLSQADTLLVWASVSYSSLAAFQAATGQEQHGLQADPKWSNAAGGDFRLLPGSPAIDSADSGNPDESSTDVLGNPRVDDPVTADTGAGPRTYDDRGAYEYQALPIDHLTLSPASSSIESGAALVYTVQATDTAGTTFDVTSASTITIAPDGSCTGATCTATALGPHTVTATLGGTSTTASLTVTASTVDHIAISPSSSTIAAGSSQAYTVQAFDTGGGSVDVTSASSFSIAPDGSCTANSCTASAGGAHTVTATYNGRTAQATLQIDLVVNSGFETDLTGWNTSGSGADIVLDRVAGGHSGGFAARLSNTGTTTNTYAVLQDSPNWVQTTAAGTYTASIWVRADTAGGVFRLKLQELSGTTLVGSNVTQATLSTGWQKVTVTYTVASPGSTLDFQAYLANPGPGVDFYADDASVMLGAGGSATLASIVVTPHSTSVAAGGTATFTAEGFDAGGGSLGDVTASTTFTITPDGSCAGNVCTATTAGAHTVHAADGSATDTATLTVNAAALDHLVLSPAGATVATGQGQAYTAEGIDQYGNSRGDVTASTSFSIAPDGSCAANVCSASAAGQHTVTGTSGSATGTAILDATPGTGTLDHIVISPSSSTIAAGASQTYTVEGFDAGGNSLGDLTSSTSFSIAPNGSCTANSCTATAGGSHTVTATVSGKTSQASLQINLIRNYGFETDTSGWNTSSSSANIVLDRVAGGHSGGFAARLSNTGTTTGSYAVLQDSPNWVTTTVAGTYTASLWVRADAAGGAFKLKVSEYNGSTLVGSAASQITLTTSWQQITVTYTIASPGSALDFQSYLTNPPPGVDFYADDASLTLG